MFIKAKREAVPVKVALIGPSGSGKTLSALLLAKGLGGSIALIDTESKRGLYYADRLDYDYLQLSPPFSPDAYIKVVGEAYKAEYKNIIIDSGSHEWVGKGGCLEMHTAETNASTSKNSYTAWNKITPKHNLFIDCIVRCPVNLIITLRGKDEYVQETNERGKVAPKKIGVGAQMRDGLEYECTVAFLLDQETHLATATKDINDLFSTPHIITEETGKTLYNWANTIGGKEGK